MLATALMVTENHECLTDMTGARLRVMKLTTLRTKVYGEKASQAEAAFADIGTLLLRLTELSYFKNKFCIEKRYTSKAKSIVKYLTPDEQYHSEFEIDIAIEAYLFHS